MAYYVSWRWGKRGRDTLSWLAGLLLNSALPKPCTSEFAASLSGKEIGLLTVEAARPLRIRAGVGDAQPACIELQGQMTAKFAAGLSNGDIAIRTRWIGGRLEDYYVQVADIASQLAWIVAALKEPPDTKMSFTRARIVGFQDKEFSLEPEDFCPCFRIVHEVAPNQLLNDSADTCWHQLFTGLNVAVGFPVPERPDGIGGVELPLSLMTTLANVDYAVAYKTGFVLKGWRNALFPVSNDQDSCLSEATSTLQWHLFSSGKGRLYMEEAQEIKPDLLPVKPELTQEGFTTVIEQMKRHFLGLYENATIRIGTDYSRSDKIEEVNIDNKPKVTSQRRLFCWTRVINFSAGGGPPGASLGISTGVRLRTKKERELRLNMELTVNNVIQRTLINSTILYDTQTEIAWMLPQICVVLYLVQAWAKHYAPANENIHYPTFKTYDKDIGKLISDLTPFWEDRAAQEANFDLREAFIYFARVLDRLQDEEDLMPQSTRLAGVDFAKLASQRRSYLILKTDVDRATCGEWLNMLRNDWKDTKTSDEPYRVVTLFCDNLDQPPFLPLLPPHVVRTICLQPPEGCNYLVVHQHCLQKLTAIYGLDPVQVSSKHCCVRGEQLPFQDYSNRRSCNPLQMIVKKRNRYLEMTRWIGKDPPYAVFIFGDTLGSNFQKCWTYAL